MVLQVNLVEQKISSHIILSCASILLLTNFLFVRELYSLLKDSEEMKKEKKK